MKDSELMILLAQDIKMLCDECIVYEEDGYGRRWETYKCPMYQDGCIIGDPSSWDLERTEQ